MFQYSDPAPAEGLEKPDLGLHHSHLARKPLDESQQHGLDGGSTVGQSARFRREEIRKEVIMGIESRAERVSQIPDTADHFVGEVLHLGPPRVARCRNM